MHLCQRRYEEGDGIYVDSLSMEKWLGKEKITLCRCFGIYFCNCWSDCVDEHRLAAV